MTVLRHEEFTEGCAAACNGPYDGRWSKCMIGYGDEDTTFVLELTYNYSVKSYDLGNDFNGITISSRKVFQNLSSKGAGAAVPGRGSSTLQVASPDGYIFHVVDEDVAGPNPVTEVALHVTDLKASLAYWHDFLKFKVEEQSGSEALLSTGGEGQARLRLVQLPAGTSINRGTAFGRIAFACPGEQLQQLEQDVKAAGYTVHTPYVSLDTPGKATVQVVILQDPDGHEICFVGEEGFRDLSRVDPEAPRLLSEAIAADKSKEWAVQQAQREALMAAKGV